MNSRATPAYNFDYIVAHLTQYLLRDLWDEEVRRKFLSQFVNGPADPRVKPIAGIGIGEIPGTGGKQLEFLSAIDGERLRIEDLLSVRGLPLVPFTVANTGRIRAATGTVRAASKRAQGGDRIERRDGPSGTFGCLVDAAVGSAILTCLHVLAPVNERRTRYEILWSGRLLGISEIPEPLVLGANGDNKVDAALCKPDDLSKVAPGLRQLGLISGSVPDPDFGLRVKKEGAESGVTQGAIRLKGLSMVVTFDTGDEAIFTNQLGIIGTSKRGRFAQQGDSGAVIINENKSPVALLSSVAEGVDLTFANPIETVFRKLQIYGMTTKVMG